MKNYFVYKDLETKEFNNVTVVKGIGELKTPAVDMIIQHRNEIEDLVWHIKGDIQKVGKSKCAPEDKYDKHRGFVIASRKAELKAMNSSLKQITNLRKELENFLELVKDIEDKLDFKMVKQALELVAITRK